MYNEKNNNSERGIVLVLVLIIIAMLTIVVADFTFSTYVDFEISANTRNDLKARYIAKSGVNVVTGALKNNALEDLVDVGSSFAGIQIDKTEFWSLKVPTFPVGDGSVSITVGDERSKINLNSLVNQQSNKIDFQVLTALTELFKFLEVDSSKSELFIASLINWLDRELTGSQNDQDPRGANGSFYQGLDNPYIIKDGTMDSIEEIRMIEGMDEEFYNKVRDYVTVYPRNKQVNFSTAPKPVIIATLKAAQVSAIQGQNRSKVELKDDVAATIADEIIQTRQDDNIITRREVRDTVRQVDSTLRLTSGLSGLVLNRGTSEVFLVKSVGLVGGDSPTVKEIEAVVRKSVSRNQPRTVDIVFWKEK